MRTRTVLLIAIAISGLVILLFLAQHWLSGPAADSPDTADATVTTTEKPTFTGLPDDPSKSVDAIPAPALPAVQDVSLQQRPAVTGEAQAQQVLDDQAVQLGLSEGSRLVMASHSDDGFGNIYYHSQQFYRGIPVVGARANLEVRAGRAEALSGIWMPELTLNSEPTYRAEVAFRQALDQRGVPGDRPVHLLDDGELVIYLSEQGAHLCWQLRALLLEPETMPRLYLVDAHEPRILHEQVVFER